MIFEQIMTGGDRNFGYLVGDREAGVAALIDPSYDPDRLVDRAETQNLKVEYIFNTHGHHDHVNGNAVAQKRTGAEIVDSSVAIGRYTLEVIPTPGHTDDHMVIYCPQFQFAFTGDHLFVGKIGGTGTEEQARQQYESLWLLFEKLPEHTTIWPGHDVGCRPSSTLALERASNPFLIVNDFEAFLALKHTWATYKKEKGLI